MVLRLILVSLVAGLSFDMPTRRDLDTMARSAQHWVKTRLAEWDPQAPSDYETYVLVTDPAPTTLPAAAPAPVTVPDDEFASVLNDNVALFAQDELAGTTREMDQFVKSSDQLAAVEPSKSFAIDLPTEPAMAVSEEWIATDITEIAFEGWAEEATPSNPVDAAVADPVPQLDLAFEGVIEETVINFALDATTLAKSERSSDNDSLEVESIPSAIETSRTENRLTNAVRLTREAVVAWASLLHGPAVVTIAP